MDLLCGPLGSFPVRDAFDAVAGGETLKHAAQRLGLRDSRLSDILHNRTYAGQDGAEPLVRPDVFEQVCDRLEATLVTKTGTKRFNLLRGLVTCQCGFSFVGDAGGRGWYYYRCDSFGHREKSCGAAMLEANRFEALVWSQCLEILNDPHSIFNDTVLVNLEQKDLHRSAEIAKVREQLGECAKRRDFVMRQATAGRITESEAETYLEEIRVTEAALQAELAMLDDSRSLSAAYSKRIKTRKALINELRGHTDVDNPADRRRMVETLLAGITVQTAERGPRKRARLTLRWLAQDAYSVAYNATRGQVDFRDLNDVSAPQTLLTPPRNLFETHHIFARTNITTPLAAV